MAFSQTVKFIWSEGSNSVEQSFAQSSGAESNIDEEFTTGTTDGLTAFTLDYSQCKVFYMLASGGALTVKTNSSGAPDQTIALASGVPYVWVATSGITCPITTDITALYITNASGATVTRKIRSLTDPTA